MSPSFSNNQNKVITIGGANVNANDTFTFQQKISVP